jgi:hypothetical protein
LVVVVQVVLVQPMEQRAAIPCFLRLPRQVAVVEVMVAVQLHKTVLMVVRVVVAVVEVLVELVV